MESVQVIKRILGLRPLASVRFPIDRTAAELTSMTSSNTTNAVPFVLDSFPILTCRKLPYRPKRSYRSSPVML